MAALSVIQTKHLSDTVPPWVQSQVDRGNEVIRQSHNSVRILLNVFIKIAPVWGRKIAGIFFNSVAN
jgi:hypothetical protein